MAAKNRLPLLSVRGLKVIFGRGRSLVTAVSNLDVDVHKGETVVIVGESGSGKSVTALAIMRLIEFGGGVIAKGSVNLLRRNGRVEDVLQLDGEHARRLRGDEIAMIFQEPMTSLNPVFTIGEQLIEAIVTHQDAPRGKARTTALELLEKVRIPDAKRLYRSYPHHLSGGMRQRVMIAMALSCRPQLLIADEPTTALDVTIQAQILRLIHDLQAENAMSVLLITHDMGVVAEIADRVIVMYRGEKVEEGDVKSVLSDPQHAYTRALLQAAPRLGACKGRDSPARFAVAGRVALKDGAARAVPIDYDKPPVLSVRELTARFDVGQGFFGKVTKRVHAVEGVDLDIWAGETLGLVGESGCGKSTAGRAILQLVKSRSSRLMFDGQDMRAISKPDLRSLRRHIQFIFQDPYASLNPRLTVGYSICEPMLIHRLESPKTAMDKAVWLLEQVGLRPEHAKRYPHAFSGGQRQRIAIARALGTNPKLIIADEVVSALDVSVQARIVDLMMDLQEKFALAWLFISHDMAVVERVSHRVAVLYLGQIVEIGSRRTVFENPVHSYTRRLMNAAPVLDTDIRIENRPLMTGEIPSPVRCVNDPPKRLTLREISPGHRVALQ
ncbi:MAG: dipeptide ABC transporter ATP-binding protein [Hyphomicrobiales bacterium]